MEELTPEDKEILEAVSMYKTPFTQGSEAAAKARLMAMAAESIGESNTNTGLWRYIGVAASIAILIGAGYLFFFSTTDVHNLSGENISKTLPDGSEIILTDGSYASYNNYFWKIQRTVSLNGEAFFDVAEGSKFTVSTPVGNVNVHGTKFSVWADNNDLFVHCAEGKVEVSAMNSIENLVAGECTSLQNGKLLAAQKFHAPGFLEPRNLSELYFENAPVHLVVSELERILKIEIEHSLESHLRYTGTLNSNNITECISVFCKPFGAEFDQKEDLVTIRN